MIKRYSQSTPPPPGPEPTPSAGGEAPTPGGPEPASPGGSEALSPGESGGGSSESGGLGPPLGGGGGGGPSLGGLGGGIGGPGGGSGGADSTSTQGGGPPPYAISEWGDIVSDFELQKMVSDGMSADDITEEIWKEYGGDPRGLGNSKKGQREDAPNNEGPEFLKNEQDRTKNSKWERLKAGTTIADIVKDQDNLKNLVVNFIKSNTKKPSANVIQSWYKYAKTRAF